jgi:hypothetical protein
MHSLPTAEDDDVDQPYKSAAALQKAGVVFSISDDDAQTRGKIFYSMRELLLLMGYQKKKQYRQLL